MSNIDHLAGLPGVEHLLRILYHVVDIALHTLFMECRLHETPLLAMSLALDSQQAFAQHFHQVAASALSRYKVAGVLGQHVANIFRAEEEYHGLFARVDSDHIAIDTLHLFYKLQL